MKLTKELEKKIKEENIKLHNQGADNYDNYPPYLLKKEDKINFNDIRFIRKLIKKKKAIGLDCGCGTGKLAINILKNGFDAEILDISPKMVEVAKRKIAEKFGHKKKIKTHVSDVETFLEKTKGKYDLICFTATLHHIGDYHKVLKTAIKKLNKEGFIYITDGQEKEEDDNLTRAFNWFSGHMNNMYKATRNPVYAAKFVGRKIKNRLRSMEKKAIGKKAESDNTEQIDVNIAEFHASHGINEKKLIGFFKRNKLKIIKYETFTLHYFRFLELFNPILKNKPKVFKLIVRRT